MTAWVVSSAESSALSLLLAMALHLRWALTGAPHIRVMHGWTLLREWGWCHPCQHNRWSKAIHMIPAPTSHSPWSSPANCSSVVVLRPVRRNVHKQLSGKVVWCVRPRNSSKCSSRSSSPAPGKAESSQQGGLSHSPSFTNMCYKALALTRYKPTAPLSKSSNHLRFMLAGSSNSLLTH